MLLLSSGALAQNDQPLAQATQIIRIELRHHELIVGGHHFTPAQSDQMVAELKRMRRVHGAAQDAVVKIVADDDAPYDDVAIVLSVVRKAGLKTVVAYREKPAKDSH
jgi:biopolymer transport protein ExbD